MPYYGDYYRGDYYRGDPGIFGGIAKFLGGAVKRVAGTALSLTPVGRIATTAIGAIASRARQGRGVIGSVAPALPFSAGGTGLMLRPPPIRMFGGGEVISGSSSTAPGVMFGRKRRRMNVANVKALRRAIRRSRGFVKLARKTVGVFGLSVQRRGAGKKARR